jgi:PPIC-type PPIASE domain
VIVRHFFAVILCCSMVFGQAATTMPPAQPAATTPAGAALPPDTPVITIKGVCDPPAADCTTVITRAEFEGIIQAFQPQMKLPQQRQVGTSYGQLMTMAAEAKKRGLDKSPRVQVRTRIAVMQALAGELRDNMQEQAGNVTDADAEKYFNDHKANYEQADVERLIIPRTPLPAGKDADKDAGADKDDADKPAAKKPVTAAAKAGTKAAPAKAATAKPKTAVVADEAGMAALAAKLRARAAAGEDFAKLQAEAFAAANIKGAPVETKVPKATRATLPPSIFDLKSGEVSELIPDSRAFFVYKMGTKTTLSLDEAKNDVKTAMKNERIQEAQKAVSDISTTTLNDAYFGPPEPAAAPGGPGRQPQSAPPSN